MPNRKTADRGLSAKSTPRPEAGVSRREFIGSAAAAAATITIVPSYVLGGPGKRPPSEKLGIAQIGCGGKGYGDLRSAIQEGGQVVAMCDVDKARAGKTFKQFRNVPKFGDFRKMLDKRHKDIDAVIISTPDHTHAVAAMHAIKMKKHVYVQKPLTRTIHEARQLTLAARKYGVVTQMGNQGHGGHYLPLAAEYIRAGAIGKVRQVHCWTNRPVWPQGVPTPTGAHKVPATLDWDLWLGPAAERPYHSSYLPFNWRGWWDFGAGALGDMACHNMDPAFFALGLKHPTSVKVRTSGFNGVSFPKWTVIRWVFPVAGRDPVPVFWYSGGKRPPRPDEMAPGKKLDGNGILFVGESGTMLGEGSAGRCAIIPKSKHKATPVPRRSLPRSIGHYKEWVHACLGKTHEGKRIVPGSNFDYAGPMTEAILTGCVAMRFDRQELTWDGAAMRFTNNDEANKYLHYEYRKGWTL